MSSIERTPQLPDIFRGFEGCNQLLPTKTYWNNVGPMQKATVDVVEISTNPAEGDIYEVSKGKYPLTKRGLSKIAHAAGISFHPEYSRVEEHTPTYCRYKAVGAMRKADGTFQVCVGTYFIDLDADAKAGMSADRLKMRKQFIVQLCEAGAMNRAIRELLAIRSSYSIEELKKPFAVPRVDFAPDLSDPTVKRFLLEQATSAAHQIYPPPVSRQLHAPVETVENGEAEEIPAAPEDDGLDEPAPRSGIEDIITVFQQTDPVEQQRMFLEACERRGLDIGTREKPTEIRTLWRKNRVEAYRKVLSTKGGK